MTEAEKLQQRICLVALHLPNRNWRRRFIKIIAAARCQVSLLHSSLSKGRTAKPMLHQVLQLCTSILDIVKSMALLWVNKFLASILQCWTYYGTVPNQLAGPSTCHIVTLAMIPANDGELPILPPILKACHGHTKGRVFLHRTWTLRHRTCIQYIPFLNHESGGISWNLQYHD